VRADRLLRHIFDYMFRRALAEREHPPLFVGLDIEQSDYDRRVLFRMQFQDQRTGEQLQIHSSHDLREFRELGGGVDLRDELDARNLTHAARAMYSRMVEDRIIERQRQSAVQILIDAVNSGDDPAVLNAARELIMRLDQHVPEAPERAQTATEIRAQRDREFYGRSLQDAINERAQLSVDRNMLSGAQWTEAQRQRMSQRLDREVLQQQTERTPPAERYAEAYHRYRDPRGQRDMLQEFRHVEQMLNSYGPGHTPEAIARGEKLLQDNLTKEQRKELKKRGFFHVEGGATGKWYRIKRGRQQNVIELDDGGMPKIGRCFLPSGNLVEGDIMIGQKAELEICELEAIAISNPFSLFVGDKGVIGPKRTRFIEPPAMPEKTAREEISAALGEALATGVGTMMTDGILPNAFGEAFVSQLLHETAGGRPQIEPVPLNPYGYINPRDLGVDPREDMRPIRFHSNFLYGPIRMARRIISGDSGA
jgi:hypothetical protein